MGYFFNSTVSERLRIVNKWFPLFIKWFIVYFWKYITVNFFWPTDAIIIQYHLSHLFSKNNTITKGKTLAWSLCIVHVQPTKIQSLPYISRDYCTNVLTVWRECSIIIAIYECLVCEDIWPNNVWNAAKIDSDSFK